jgi:hypothetical protein
MNVHANFLWQSSDSPLDIIPCLSTILARSHQFLAIGKPGFSHLDVKLGTNLRRVRIEDSRGIESTWICHIKISIHHSKKELNNGGEHREIMKRDKNECLICREEEGQEAGKKLGRKMWNKGESYGEDWGG